MTDIDTILLYVYMHIGHRITTVNSKNNVFCGLTCGGLCGCRRCSRGRGRIKSNSGEKCDYILNEDNNNCNGIHESDGKTLSSFRFRCILMQKLITELNQIICCFFNN